MAKRTNTQPAASVIAFAGTLSVARASQLAAIESWADVYESAAFMLSEVPSRDLAKQLEAAGAHCNKDTAGFYADAAVWAPLMRTDGEVDSLFMRAAVMADQSATLLPHECVSYGRNRAGLSIDGVREIMRDASIREVDSTDEDMIEQLSAAIRTLRTAAKKSRQKSDPQTDGDSGEESGEESGEGTGQEANRASNLIAAIIGPMHALATELASGEITLTAQERDTLNAHWAELVKAVRSTEAAA